MKEEKISRTYMNANMTLLLGVISLFISFAFLGAIPLGIYTLVKMKQTGETKGRILVIIGLILGCIGLVRTTLGQFVFWFPKIF